MPKNDNKTIDFLEQWWANFSIEESFAQNQKHQQGAKSVCSVKTKMVKNASFT